MCPLFPSPRLYQSSFNLHSTDSGHRRSITPLPVRMVLSMAPGILEPTPIPSHPPPIPSHPPLFLLNAPVLNKRRWGYRGVGCDTFEQITRGGGGKSVHYLMLRWTEYTKVEYICPYNTRIPRDFSQMKDFIISMTYSQHFHDQQSPSEPISTTNSPLLNPFP